MSLRVSGRGVGNLLVACMVLTLFNTATSLFLVFVYMPAREQADKRMAEIMIWQRDEWEKQNTRIIR